MIQLDVGRDGQVWAVSTDKNIYRRVGITVDILKGTNWEEVPYGGHNPSDAK
jgi:hypothetical protein